MGAEAEREELGFDDVSSVGVDDIRGCWGQFSGFGGVIVSPLACGEVGDDFRTGEVEA